MSRITLSGSTETRPQVALKPLCMAIGVACLSFLIFTSAAVLAYRGQSARATDDAMKHLENAAEADAALIRYWFSERVGDVRVMGTTSRVRTEFESYLQGGSEDWLRMRLEGEREARDYVNVTLFDTTGKARLSVGRPSPGREQDLVKHAVEAASITTGTVVGFHPAEDGSYHVTWFTPLRIEEEAGHERTTGVVMFESDLRQYLSSVMRGLDDPWPTTVALRFITNDDAFIATSSNDFQFELMRDVAYPGPGTMSFEVPVEPGAMAVLSSIEQADLNGSLAWQRWTIIGLDALVLAVCAAFVLAFARSDMNRRKELLAKERLQEAIETQDRFLANVSHDLRTPLNSIIGFSGTLRRGMAGPLNPEQQRQITMVESSGRHLLALVTDILDFSKLKKGDERLDPEVLRASDLVGLVSELLAPQVTEKGLTWETSVPEDLEVITDRHLAERVLLNLAGNAVKFTVNGGVTITVTHRSDGSTAFAVRDTGPGIDYGVRREIMREFRQLHRPGTTKPEGAGLGLSISERTAHLLGGEIEVASVPGEGATFTFVVPPHGAVS